MLYTHNQKHLPLVSSADFLPPISRWTSLAGIFLVGAVGSAIALSSYIQYNVTVKAEATVRPLGDIRLVQPEMEGTISKIFVKENQIIKEGDTIALLDVTQLQIKKSQLQANIHQRKLQLVQINAQIATLDAQILAEEKVIERTIAAAKADFSHNQREYQDKQITTQSELIAAKASLQKAQADLKKAHADLDFTKSDVKRYQQLVTEGVVGKRELDQKQLAVLQTKSFVEAEQESVEIAKAKVKTALVSLNPSKAKVTIAQERIAQETAKGEANIATLKKEKQALIERRVEMINQIAEYHKELQQIAKQFDNSLIRATADGIILKLNLRNSGQVVRSGEAIAQIVPGNAPLIIKAMIPNAEIQKVAIGQKAQLRVDACPYPDYGTLKGVVSAISADRITSNDNTDIATPVSATSATKYFEATIQPESLVLGNSDRTCQIQSGMDAKAEIISQEETALQFLLRKARLITDL